MITEFIQMLKGWPVVFQFFFTMLIFYFVFYIVSDIVTKTLDFLCSGLPVIIRGWPEDYLDDEDDVEKNKETKSEKSDK